MFIHMHILNITAVYLHYPPVEILASIASFDLHLRYPGFAEHCEIGRGQWPFP